MSKPSNQAFGELLRQHRRGSALSQEALAERAGISASAVAALEQGLRRAPYRYTVDALVAALGIRDDARREFEDAAATSRVRRGRQRSTDLSNNIPATLTSFVGRAAELSELKALVDEHRLVTLVGSGGVGKTRMAIEVAREMLAGRWKEAWFVDLAPIARGEHIAGTIAAAVGHTLAPGDNPMQSLATQLRRRECLLILDNCEHIIDDAAQAAGLILRSCPGIAIVATTRERLAIDGEYVYRLPALTAATALELFAERAKASDASVAFTDEERETGAEICRQLEGIPLAIELVARRVPALGLNVLNARLRDYVVISGGRDLPLRQQTMYATIAWSYDLLRTSEQSVLRRLAIFRGAMTLDAAQLVCSLRDLANEEVVAPMLQLADKSLVEVHADGSHGRKYRLLDSVRSFGIQKLEEAHETEDVARAHARWMASVAGDANEARTTLSRVQWFIRFGPTLDEARGAIEWALKSDAVDDLVLAARIVGGLRPLFIRSGLSGDAGVLAERVLARIDDEHVPIVAARLHRMLIQAAPDKDTAVAAIERAMPLFERIGDTEAIVGSELQLAWHFGLCGQFAQADAALDRAFSRVNNEGISDSPMRMLALEYRGYVYTLAGKLEEARADLAQWRRIRVSKGITDSLEDCGLAVNVAVLGGDFNEALAILEKALAQRTDAGSRIYYSEAPAEMAAVYLALGDHATAAELVSESLESIAGEWESVAAIEVAAAIAARSGQAAVAAKLLGFTDGQHVAKRRLRWPMERFAFDILTASIRENITHEEIERYGAEGARLDLQQAADAALSVL